MKAVLTCILLFGALFSYSQCKVEGTITLKKGDMVPRADVGATVFLIPKSSVSKKQSARLLSFLEIEKSRQLYLMQVAAMGKRRGKQKSEEMMLEPVALDDEQYEEATNETIKTFRALINVKDVKLTTTDVKGGYLLDLACGEYYILVNSNGRLGSRYNLSKYSFSALSLQNGSVEFSKEIEFE